MKKKFSFLTKLIAVICILFIVIGLARLFIGGEEIPIKGRQGSILELDLKGMIIEKNDFLKKLRKYSKNNRVKGVLIRLDSPGGTVAASQEIYNEFKKIKEHLKKPVVVSVGSMMASGALYAAAGASAILVNSGSLVGSIGVVIKSINMERLYDWAKMEPNTIKTGEFKDIGTSQRALTSRERILLQDLANEMLQQFQTALSEGRKISPEELEPYTDARVFTGETAVSAGFADSIGSYSDAIELVGELSGLGKEPFIFTPQPSYFDRISGRFGGVFNKLQHLFSHHQFNMKPLYILPAALGM